MALVIVFLRIICLLSSIIMVFLTFSSSILHAPACNLHANLTQNLKKKTKRLLVYLRAKILVLYCNVTKTMLVPYFALYHYEVA